jgi:hypothetical protein
MAKRKFTSSAATSLHLEGDINRLPEVRCWSRDTKNSPFVTERVSSDFRVHDLVGREIRHCEVESLRGTLINIVRWTVSNKAAVLLNVKPDWTLGGINVWRLSETLAKH